MIPGGYSPADRPVLEQELHADDNSRPIHKKSSVSTWITLAVILVAIAAVVLLLSFMPT